MPTRNLTPLPSTSLTLDTLLTRPHTRLLNATTILYHLLMPTRKADEANLTPERPDGRTVRPRTGSTTTGAPTLQINPLTVPTNPQAATTLTTSNASPNAEGNAPPTAVEPPETEDTDAEMKALDILTYVHLPHPDPLQIHGWDTIKALENLSPRQINLWTGVDSPKVLIYKAHGGKFKKDCGEETLQIRELIKGFLKTTTKPIIAIPVPASDGGKKEDPPFCALVRGLSQEQSDELVKKVMSHDKPTHPKREILTHHQRFLSSAELTIFITPFDPPPSSFVTTLKSFLFIDENDAQSEAAVAQIVTNAMFTDDGSSDLPNTIRRFIAKNRDNIESAIINIDDALRFIRSSIRVKRLNLLKKDDIDTGLGKPSPAWNIYFYPPTTNQTAIREWRDIIRRTKFVTDVNREGRTVKIFNCSVCHSEDHPAGMCPYPTQPDWAPPATTTTTPPVPTASTHVQPNDDARTTTRRGRSGQSSTRGRTASNRKGKVNTKA